MDILRNNKGSTTIFTAIVIGVVLTLIVSVVQLTKLKTEKGKIKSTLMISGRSILSEYNPYIEKRYGILALNKDDNEIKKGMEFYVHSNLSNKRIERVNLDRSQYRLDNLENFENEMLEYMKISAMGVLEKKSDKNKSERKGERVLRNSKVKNLLPSKAQESMAGNMDKIKEFISSVANIDKIFDKTKKAVVIDEYIIRKFNNKIHDDGSTFFKNEVEYIVSGNMSDKKNGDKFHNKLLVLRNLVNLAVIHASPSMRAKAVAASSVTGPFSPLAYLGIVEAWALAEARNDVKILEHNGKIPIIKKEKDWMVDIKNIKSIITKDYIDNKCAKGMGYEDYLRVFLFLTTRETKLKRTMDLIQINTLGNHDESFSFSKALKGIKGSIKINEKVYWFDEKY